MTPNKGYILPRERTAIERMAVKSLRWQTSRFTFDCKDQPYCDDPVFIANIQRSSDYQYPMEVTRYAPCRKCSRCVLFRRLQWRERMKIECSSASRTWFLTLTFAPVHLSGIIAEAHMRRPNGLVDVQCVERSAYFHVQKYLKRLRKAGERFRYVFIPEYGEEKERLHYHALIHEIDKPVRWDTLNSAWRSFTYANLVRDGPRCSGYVCKYLTKGNTLIRASRAYGAPETKTA